MTALNNDVKSVFGKALELDAPLERAAFLDRVCAGNAGLRAEVEMLLQALEQAGNRSSATVLTIVERELNVFEHDHRSALLRRRRFRRGGLEDVHERDSRGGISTARTPAPAW